MSNVNEAFKAFSHWVKLISCNDQEDKTEGEGPENKGSVFRLLRYRLYNTIYNAAVAAFKDICPISMVNNFIIVVYWQTRPCCCVAVLLLLLAAAVSVLNIAEPINDFKKINEFLGVACGKIHCFFTYLAQQQPHSSWDFSILWIICTDLPAAAAEQQNGGSQPQLIAAAVHSWNLQKKIDHRQAGSIGRIST